MRVGFLEAREKVFNKVWEAVKAGRHSVDVIIEYKLQSAIKHELQECGIEMEHMGNFVFQLTWDDQVFD